MNIMKSLLLLFGASVPWIVLACACKAASKPMPKPPGFKAVAGKKEWRGHVQIVHENWGAE